MRIRGLEDQGKDAERDYLVRQEKEERAIKHYENDISGLIAQGAQRDDEGRATYDQISGLRNEI